MSAVLVTLPERSRIQAVFVKRYGMGWRVGIGGLVAGEIEREPLVFMRERDAVAGALALADAHDLIAVRD